MADDVTYEAWDLADFPVCKSFLFSSKLVFSDSHNFSIDVGGD